MKIKLAKTELIHFVGIGGIGMSGLALIMKGKGFKVQGSDIANNKNIERLRKEKIKVFIGHKKQNIEKGTILVVSSAIKKNNPELLAAKKKQLPIYKRGEMLANIVSLTKNIVVVGSHGKTTTTSLIASIFQETKIDPTIINGGVINSINNSAKLGKSDWSILEADESDGSFVYIPPTYSIITNIDREHMDYYGTIDKLNKYFENFVNKVPSFGKSFICLDDKNNKNLIKNIKNKNFYTYGLDNKSNFCIKNIKQLKDHSEFDLIIKLPNKKNQLIKKFKIPLLGTHNIKNSVAAAALSLTVGTPINDIKKLIENFSILDEKFINQKYKSIMEVEFNRKKLIKFLDSKNITISLPKKINVFFIPVMIDLETNNFNYLNENIFAENWESIEKNYFQISYIIPNEDAEDYLSIKNNLEDIENYNFKKILNKYYSENFIIMIIFKRKNNIKFYSKINFDDKFEILSKNFKDKNIDNQTDLNSMILNIKNEYEDNWKSINKMSPSTSVPIRLSLESNNTEKSLKLENALGNLDFVNSYNIEKFDSKMIIYKVYYSSSPKRFLKDILSYDISIDTSSSNWKIK